MKLALDEVAEETQQFPQTKGRISAFGSVTAPSASAAAARPPAATGRASYS